MIRSLLFAILFIPITISNWFNIFVESQDKNPVLATIGTAPITLAEFKYVYQKNTNAQDSTAYTEKALKEYLNLYINFKLKVAAGKALGIDTTEAFQQELEGYKIQLAKPFLAVKEVTDFLVKQAYERLKEEVNVSHILIVVSPEAEAKDTLVAYNKIAEIRKRAFAGEDFNQLAINNSQDPSVKLNKGNLGYFTALQMVYPFEEAAYNTKVGDVSSIIRTQFGYHILKVHDHRKSNGKVEVAHIMLKLGKNTTKEDSIANKKKIEEIYTLLKKGEDWNKLVLQFSEDAKSRTNQGQLPPFGIGTTIPSFEEAAFALKNPNEISKPIYTPYGWHILKLISKQELESFDEIEPLLTQKVSRDSRSQVNQNALLKKLKAENKLVEYKKVWNKAIIEADSNLLKGTWSYNLKASFLENILFSFEYKPIKKKTTYTVKSFFDYVKSVQVEKKELSSPQHALKLYYQDYINKQSIAFEKEILADKYPEYQNLITEYKEGIILFQMMTDKVWNKSIIDTVGAKKFFENNKEKYRWDIRATAVIYDAANEKILAEVKSKLTNNLVLIEAQAFNPMFFDKNQAELTKDMRNALEDIFLSIQTSPDFVIEIAGHADPSESKDISMQRANKIAKYLLDKGLPITQIIKKDYSKYQPLSKVDRKQNSRVAFALYTNSKKALEKEFNKTEALNLKVNEGTFMKGENVYLDQVTWKPGNYTLKEANRAIYITISKIQEPRLKTFDEAKGNVISAYQEFLEAEWVKELEQKYPVKINQEELLKLVKKP